MELDDIHREDEDINFEGLLDFLELFQPEQEEAELEQNELDQVLLDLELAVIEEERVDELDEVRLDPIVADNEAGAARQRLDLCRHFSNLVLDSLDLPLRNYKSADGLLGIC